MDYANRINETLEINEKNKFNGSFPLIMSIRNNNFEITQLLIEYAKK